MTTALPQLTGLRYEIDENNGIRVWHDGQADPFIYQPDYPDGTQFIDRNDAESWAQAKIAELTDIDAPMAPNSPNEEPKMNPWKYEYEKQLAKENGIAKLIALGLSEQEAKAIAGTI